MLRPHWLLDPTLHRPGIARPPGPASFGELVAGLGLVVLGVLIVVVPLDQMIQTARFRSDAVVTTGEVLSLDASDDYPYVLDQDIDLWDAVVLFDVSGTETIASVTLGLTETFFFSPDRGDILPIAFHPTAPRRPVRFYNAIWEHTPNVTVVVIGLVYFWILIPLGPIFTNRSQRTALAVLAAMVAVWLLSLRGGGIDTLTDLVEIRYAARRGDERPGHFVPSRNHPASVNDFGDSPLLLAVARGDEESVAGLLGADVNHQNVDGTSALMIAAHDGATAIVDQLIKAGAAVDLANADGWTALAFAAAGGRLEIAERLLEEGAATTAGSAVLSATTPAGHERSYLADDRGHGEIAGLIGSRSDARRALETALRRDDTEAARNALQSGASPNDRYDDERASALFAAAASGNLEMFKMLRDAGALPLLFDRRGRGLCVYAHRGRNDEIVQMAGRLTGRPGCQ